MTQVVNPSDVVSAAQIGKMCDLFAAGLRKTPLQKGSFQSVIETLGGQLVGELLEVVHKYVQSSICEIIRVDRSVRIEYPHQLKEGVHPELEAVGPSEYNINSDVEQWLHSDQYKGEKWEDGRVRGQVIYEHLKETDTLKYHLDLRDLEEIQKKGIYFYQKHFGDQYVYGWKSVARGYGNDNGFVIPQLSLEPSTAIRLGWRGPNDTFISCVHPGRVVLTWSGLEDSFGYVQPALRFRK